ncbi:MAG: DUF86 domain-containing protein [Blastocatellales bacterium]
MRHEELYLRDIVEAAVAVDGFLAGVTQNEFLASDLIRSAVLHKLTIIGESAARISRDFADRFPEIDWAAISGFRNIAVHEYFAVDWRIVWVAAAKETPVLREQIEIILKEEFSR